jgi:hypothetical protein
MNGLGLLVVIVCLVGNGLGGVPAEPYPMKVILDGEPALVRALIVPVLSKSPQMLRLKPGFMVNVAPGFIVTFRATGLRLPGPSALIIGYLGMLAGIVTSSPQVGYTPGQTPQLSELNQFVSNPLHINLLMGENGVGTTVVLLQGYNCISSIATSLPLAAELILAIPNLKEVRVPVLI